MIAGVVVVLLAFSLLAAIWTVRIAQRAQLLGQELRATAGAAQGTIASADASEISILRAELAEVEPRARKLDSDLWPLRLAGSVTGWYPVLGDNIAAAPRLASRLVDDVDAALSFMEAGEKLVLMYDSIPQEAAGITASLDAMPSEDQMALVTALILEADFALARAEETSTRVNDRWLWGKIGREAEEMRNQESELRDIIDWSLLATDSLSALVQLSDASEGLTTVIDTGDTSELDRSVLRHMPALEIAAERALRVVSATVATAPESVAESSIGRNLRDLEPILDALHATARAGSLVSAVITPAFERIESSNGGLFGPGSGLLDSIALIGEGAGQLREAQELLFESGARLSDALPHIESPSAAAAADGLLTLSSELELSVGLLRVLPDLGPSALGADGPRRYLVMAESADELRPSGGLVSGAWVLTFDHGELVTNEYYDVVAIDDLTNLSSYPSPPDLLSTHMDASVWLLRDVGWEPHFPSVARTAAEIVELGQDGLPMDGVVAVTQWTLIGLAEALGSVETDQGPVPADRLLNVLEDGTDEDGRAFMNSVFQGLLDQISGPSINGNLFQLARAVSVSFTEKQTLVHMFDEDLQAIVSQAGWDGSLPAAGGDRLVPVDSNIGWSKVDRNIDRTLEYEVTLSRTGSSIGKITLGYENHSRWDGAECGAQSLNPGASYDDLKNTCYWNLIRIYTAVGGRLISADPLPLPNNSVFSMRGLGGSGDDTVSLGIGPGGSFISGLMVVPAGVDMRTSFTVQLPATVVSWDDDRATYTLDLAAQPGTLGRKTTIRVDLPLGYEYVGGSLKPTSVVGNSVVFALPLTVDAILSVEMQQTTMPTAAIPANGSIDLR